ncbi:MAG: hypothetical protein ACO1NU_05785 [Arcticibacter sp.]
MAIIDHKGAVRGTAGSVVYRTYRNKNIIQGKPRKFKQTQESVRASTEFGLSSSAAAVIRKAFEPAFFYRDGEAVSRTTAQVYRALRSSLAATAGERDLHDADLQQLAGMDFNGNSKLAEVLPVSTAATRNEQGDITVNLPAFCPRTDLRKITGFPKSAYRYRIRLMAIAFDFRKEYFEYLDMQDVDIEGGEKMPETSIMLKAQADPACMVLVSMSLLLYAEVGRTGEYVLLNSKAFSPCAIIAAYPADEASPADVSCIILSEEAYPERCHNIQVMGYEGNRLLRKLAKQLPLKPQVTASDVKPAPGTADRLPGGKISFKER